MSAFLKTISEKEIDEATSKGGKKNKKACAAWSRDLIIETALCAGSGNATFCNVMQGEADLIARYCR